MASEIRANRQTNRVGLGTVTYTDTGIVVSGIVTAQGLSGLNHFNVGSNIQLGNAGIATAGGLTLNSTDAGNSAGPELKLFRNSASPANADYLGQLKFAGESSTGVERNYAKITGKILDVTNGSEDGILEFAHIKNGSQTITGRWRSDSLQLLNGTNLTVDGSVSATSYTGDGSGLSNLPASAPVGGASTNSVFFENDVAVAVNYQITSNKNAMSAGPISINAGIAVTVPSGSSWTIV